MKRFRTKRKKKKYYLWIIFGIFLLLFSLISLCNLKSNISDKIVVFWNKKEFDKISSFNNYFGKLINLYSFDEKKNIVKDNIKISLNGNDELVNYVRKNLKKLGFDSQITTNAFITIELIDDEETAFFQNKEYSKIKIWLPNKYSNIKEKLFKYGNIIDINEGEKIIFQINSSKKREMINNSTEIVSLIIYDILGD